MPIEIKDVRSLIRTIGESGAIAGLAASNIALEDLIRLADRAKVDASTLYKRDELSAAIVRATLKKNIRPLSELTKMTYDELILHFGEVSPSNNDLILIMNELGYKVSAEDKKHLRKSVARQLSETALFANVAEKIRGESE